MARLVNYVQMFDIVCVHGDLFLCVCVKIYGGSLRFGAGTQNVRFYSLYACICDDVMKNVLSANAHVPYISTSKSQGNY